MEKTRQFTAISAVAPLEAPDGVLYQAQRGFDGSVSTGLDLFMFDARMRLLIDRPLKLLAVPLVRQGVSADQMTLIGLVVGLSAGFVIAIGYYSIGLGLILFSRLADGLDGAIARLTTKTDFGGYFDILSDFAFYAAIPVGFGLSAPENMAPALVLMGSFILSGVSFLAFAILAAKRGITTERRGSKSFYYVGGLTEGTETIALFVLACLKPNWFPWLAYSFATLCMLTAIGRTLQAQREFNSL